MIDGTSWNERVASPLVPFFETRDALLAERAGAGGSEVCLPLSDAMDEALVELFGETTGAALVAVGGSGRRRLCFYSDVDVMLLVGGAAPSALTKAVLYPLWDSKVAVGHSVRTPREAVAAAEESVETLCSLLTARHLAGDPALLAETLDGLASLLRSGRRRIGRVLEDEERTRRSATPYRLLAVDVKQGRGGLRSVDGLDWDRRARAL
ncbi:MAG: hypothetical protein GWO04_20620, partial [Actinobacteria bacterium]|nr:hypothetical protein [Actinomycetota bacterium]